MQQHRNWLAPNTTAQNPSQPNDSDSIFEYIKSEIDGLEYGSINIIIHQNKIMQIETTKKARFD